MLALRSFVKAKTSPATKVIRNIFVSMEQPEGDSLKETILNYFRKFKAWLKPDKADTLIVQSLKMVYKALAVLVLVIFSPVILIILIFVFMAAL